MSTSKIRLHVLPFSLLESLIIPRIYYKQGSADSYWPIFDMPDHKDPRERKNTIMKL